MHTIHVNTNKPALPRVWMLFAMVAGLVAIGPGVTEAKGHHGHKPAHHERGYGPGYGYPENEYWRRDHYRDRHHHGQKNRRHDVWQAERRNRAHRYASRAVDQAREARWYGYYSDHPRWRTGYKRHFRWAMDARPDKIRSEIRKRDRKLNQLRHDGRLSRHYSGHYRGQHSQGHHGPHRRRH